MKKVLEFNRENFEMLFERMQFLREEVKRYKYDFLTGLKMRKDFDDKLDRMFEAYEFEDKPFVFIMVDVDGLHNVNRLQGYAAGDSLIVGVAEKLKSIFSDQKNADVFRISGDEFGVLLEYDESYDFQIDLEGLENATWNCTIMGNGSTCLPSPSAVFKHTDKGLSLKKKSKKEKEKKQNPEFVVLDERI